MNDFLRVEEVAKMCQISKCKAYEIMREVNAGLENDGYITIRGRVNKKALFKKLGLESEVQNASV